MNTLPDELLLYILDFIPDNQTALTLSKTCKYINNLFHKNGFLKSLSTTSLRYDISDFSNMNIKHKRTLNMFHIYGIKDPHLWLYKWPKTVYFVSCNFYKGVIDPYTKVDTENLSIIDYNKHKLIINWKKFPNLIYLNLECDDVEMNGIEECKNLKKIVLKKSTTTIIKCF